jgi:hypothetical protein
MVKCEAWAEVATPTGRTYLMGPACPSSLQGGAPFGVAVYPFGFDVYKVVGGNHPVHVEAVADAPTFTRRLQELGLALAAGTWAPPELPAKVKAKQAKLQATSASFRLHPVSGAARLALRVSLFGVLIVAVLMAWHTVAGEMPTAAMIPKAVLLIALVSAAYGAVSAWCIRRYG